MIKSEWIVSNMAARNALTVASADVYQGAECMVLSTGSVFRAVRAGTGATMWAGVCTASATWAPVFSGLSNVKASPAMVADATAYTRIGDLVDCSVAFSGQLDSGTAARSFKMSIPVTLPGTLAIVGDVSLFSAPQAVVSAGTDAYMPSIYATVAASTVDVYFNCNEADATAFDGFARWQYFIAES
jgi:hypothetical protein